MMREWIVCIYRMPPEIVAQGLLLATAAVALGAELFRDRRWPRACLSCAAVLWCGAVLFSTVWRTPASVAQVPSLVPFHSYWEAWSTGRTELCRSNFMNLVLFYPGGVLACALFSGKRHPAFSVGAILALCCFSVAIEWCQFHFALGLPEIDDVIHNSLGVLLGWFGLQGLQKAMAEEVKRYRSEN